MQEDATPKTEQKPNDLFAQWMGSENEARLQRRAGHKPRLEETLNRVFGGEGWRKIDAEDADSRADQCAKLFQEITGARWGTYIRMMKDGRIRYFLLHLTNHDEGRDLMKECMWQVCPQGGFCASKADDPRQSVLVQSEPELTPLRRWVRERLSDGPEYWETRMQEFWEECGWGSISTK